MDYFKQVKYIIIILLFPFVIWGLWGRQTSREFVLAFDVKSERYQANVLKLFANNLENDTEGSLHLTLTNVEKDLWPTNKIRDAVQKGDYALGLVFLEHFGLEDPVFEMDALPFLSTNYEQAAILWEVTRPHIRKKLKAQGLIYLFSLPDAPQGLFMDRDIDSPETIKGLKVRTYGRILGEYLKSLGFTPSRFRDSEAYEQLRDLTVQGFFGSRGSGYSAQALVFARHYYRIKYSLPKHVVVINEEAFAKLSTKNQQKLLMQAQVAERIAWRMSEADDYRRKHFFDAKKFPEWLEKKSMEATLELLKEWRSKAGEEGEKLLTYYQKHLRAHLLKTPPALRSLND